MLYVYKCNNCGKVVGMAMTSEDVISLCEDCVKTFQAKGDFDFGKYCDEIRKNSKKES